jgi:hypothetical protein
MNTHNSQPFLSNEVLSRLAALFVLGLAVAVVASACGKKEEAAKADEAASDTGKPEVSGLEGVKSLADLKLSSALKVELPEGLEAAGTGEEGAALNLLATPGAKSREACMVSQSVKEAARRIQNVAGTMCHLEVEKETILIGKKTLLKLASGQEFGRLWAEKRDDGKLIVSMCMKNMEDPSLPANREIIEVAERTDAGVKGSLFNGGAYLDPEGNKGVFKGKVLFDSSEKGIVKIDSRDLNIQGQNKFVRMVDLVLVESGLSKVRLASRGKFGSNEFSERAVALFKDDYGAVLLSSKGTTPEGDSFTFTRRGLFDKEGNIVAPSAYAGFAGELKAQAKEVPAFLDADFAPDEGASAWVKSGCKETEASAVIDPESAAHNACESDQGGSPSQCWGEDFQEGDAASL